MIKLNKLNDNNYIDEPILDDNDDVLSSYSFQLLILLIYY